MKLACLDVELEKLLDLLGKPERNILVAATWNMHTKVIRLVRQPAQEGRIRWHIRTHKSLGSTKRDQNLQIGMNELLLATGLRAERNKFAYKPGDSLLQGEKKVS